jgi:hypothetical protein
MSRFKVMFLAVLGLLLLSVPQVWADSGCVHLDAQVQVASTDPTNPAANIQGTALISLANQPPVEAAITVVPGNIKVGDDGTIHMINAMTVVMSDGSVLKMDDNTVLSPTTTPFVYHVSARLTIFQARDFLQMPSA